MTFTFIINLLTDLVKSDEGLYTCVASSPSGKATWSATLYLEPRTNPNAVFFRSPEASTLPGPPSRPLMVNSTASSITISWTRNNKIGSSSLLGYQVIAHITLFKINSFFVYKFLIPCSNRSVGSF